MIHTLPNKHTLKVKGWLHPRPGLDIDTLAERMTAIPGNKILETHRDCACIGAKLENKPDDHLLMINKEITNG